MITFRLILIACTALASCRSTILEKPAPASLPRDRCTEGRNFSWTAVDDDTGYERSGGIGVLRNVTPDLGGGRPMERTGKRTTGLERKYLRLIGLRRAGRGANRNPDGGCPGYEGARLDLDEFYAVAAGESPNRNITSYPVMGTRSPKEDNCTLHPALLNCTDDLLTRFRSTWPVHLWVPQDLSVINAHWLKFAPPSRAAHYTLAVLYAVIMIVGLFGNAFTIFLYLRCRSLRTPGNILVMNLAVSDFFMLIKTPVFVYNSIYLGPAFGDFGCQLYGFLGGLTGTVSIATLAGIAAERYNVVAEPFRRVSCARARTTAIATWIYGATFAGLPLMVPILRYKPEGYLTSCSFDYLTPDSRVKTFILCFFVAAWVLPFCLISTSYVGILRVVTAARHMHIGDSVAENSSKHCREEEKRRTELKLALVVIGIIGMWFVAWTPYAVVALLGISGQSHLVTPLASMVPALFCKTASCLDPYVYAVTHPRFRSELQQLSKRNQRKRTARKGIEFNRPRGAPLQGFNDVEEIAVATIGNMVSSESQYDARDFARMTPPGLHSRCLPNPSGLPSTTMENDGLRPPSWFANPYYTKASRRVWQSIYPDVHLPMSI